MSAPCVEITHDFNKSDTIYERVPITEVEDYLKKHIRCYERTGALNRVYIDIDGKADINMTEMDFEIKDSSIQFILSGLELGSPYSLMRSSKYATKKNGKRVHIFSYRVTLLNKCGSKHAVREYVEKTLNPIIKEALKEEINYIIDKKEKVKERGDESATYLDYDEGVYSIGDPVKGTCGRKMRMWNSSKEDDYRPNEIVGESSVLDTLITYIPEGCERLPEPVLASCASVCDTESITTYRSDPTSVSDALETSVSTSNEEKQTIQYVLEHLGNHRWDNYNDWIKIGIACYNEDIPLQVWKEFSKKSPKYKNGECEKIWRNFTKGALRQGTLWAMLKEDNPEKFNEFVQKRRDFERVVFSENGHADVADYFFSIKPDNYLYDDKHGWFCVESNNVWTNSGSSYPATMIVDVFRTLKTEQVGYGQILAARRRKAAESENYSELIKNLELTEKKVADFTKKITNKAYIESVIVFLRGLYNERLKQLLLEKGKTTINEIMDEQRHLFAFNDCVFDLNIGKKRAIRPTDYITITCGYKFPKSDSAIRKEIQDTLFTLWEDQVMVDYVLNTISTSVCGTRNVEEWYIWTGSGRNGKGLLMELIKNSFGGYFYSLSNEILTIKPDKSSGNKPEIVECRVKRFLNASEPEGNDCLLEGALKLFTGGDSITASAKFKSPITYKPQFLLTLQCNNVPRLNTLTMATVKRLRLVPFPFTFVDQPVLENERKGDPLVKNVKCISEEWRDEFILMLLEQWDRVKKLMNIPIPASVKERTEEYLNENNPIGMWFKENYEFTSEKDENGKPFYVKSRDLWLDYKVSLDSNIAEKTFKGCMEFNGAKPQKISWGEEKGCMAYIGCRKIIIIKEENIK
jgi:P4 family phage/plasmid primase-like protien